MERGIKYPDPNHQEYAILSEIPGDVRLIGRDGGSFYTHSAILLRLEYFRNIKHYEGNTKLPSPIYLDYPTKAIQLYLTRFVLGFVSLNVPLFDGCSSKDIAYYYCDAIMIDDFLTTNVMSHVQFTQILEPLNGDTIADLYKVFPNLPKPEEPKSEDVKPEKPKKFYGIILLEHSASRIFAPCVDTVSSMFKMVPAVMANNDKEKFEELCENAKDGANVITEYYDYDTIPILNEVLREIPCDTRIKCCDGQLFETHSVILQVMDIDASSLRQFPKTFVDAFVKCIQSPEFHPLHNYSASISDKCSIIVVNAVLEKKFISRETWKDHIKLLVTRPEKYSISFDDLLHAYMFFQKSEIGGDHRRNYLEDARQTYHK